MVAVAALAWWPTPPLVDHRRSPASMLGLGHPGPDRRRALIVLAALFLPPRRDRLAAGGSPTSASWSPRSLVPVTAYAAWYHHEHGAWAMTEASGRALYMRTTTFVDCDTIDGPGLRAGPVSRRAARARGWTRRSTAGTPRRPSRSLDPPPGVSDQDAMRDFALRAIKAQPLRLRQHRVA